MANKNLSKDKESDYITSEQYEKVLKSDDYAKFADTFNEEKTQKLIQDSINKLILKAMACDHDTRNKVKELIREVDKEDWWNFIKKGGWAIWSIVSACLGAVATLLISNFNK